jgi:hypothetical protein
MALVLIMVLTILPHDFVVANAAELNQKVVITHNDQIVDTFNGVPAVYVTYPVTSGTYSCARYVTNYYKAIFGVKASGLTDIDSTPVSGTAGYSFKEITSGFVPGDVVRMKGSPVHWAIIKEANGNTFTLIEQNYKFTVNGAIYTTINRTVTYGSTAGFAVFRLFKGNEPAIGAPTEPPVNAYINATANAVKASAEQVTFTFGAANATNYAIVIDRVGTGRVLTEEL